MSRAKQTYVPDPRAWGDYQVAARFGKGPGWLKDHRKELETAGFPRYDALLDGTDANAVEAWFDRRSGLGQAASEEQAILEAIDGRD